MMIGSAICLGAAVLGVAVAMLTGNGGAGVAIAVGVLIGAIGSIFVVPALRRAPAGVVGAAVDEAATGWTEFHRELARARRFESPFALARFSFGDLSGDGALEVVRDEIATGARRIDRLWIDDADLLLLLPASSEAATQAMLDRIKSKVPALASVEPSVALFPEHGITSGALIAAVYGGDRNEAPTPIAAVRPEPRPHAAVTGTLDGQPALGQTADDTGTQRG
jgi:hypothetical protein